MGTSRVHGFLRNEKSFDSRWSRFEVLKTGERYVPGTYPEGSPMNMEQRQKVVQWMSRVCSNLNWLKATYMVAVNILDRFILIGNPADAPSRLPIYSVTALFLAANITELFDEQTIPPLTEFAESVPYVNSVTEVTRAQLQVLGALGGSMQTRSPFDFVTSFLNSLRTVATQWEEYRNAYEEYLHQQQQREELERECASLMKPRFSHGGRMSAGTCSCGSTACPSPTGSIGASPISCCWTDGGSYCRSLSCASTAAPSTRVSPTGSSSLHPSASFSSMSAVSPTGESEVAMDLDHELTRSHSYLSACSSANSSSHSLDLQTEQPSSITHRLMQQQQQKREGSDERPLPRLSSRGSIRRPPALSLGSDVNAFTHSASMAEGVTGMPTPVSCGGCGSAGCSRRDWECPVACAVSDASPLDSDGTDSISISSDEDSHPHQKIAGGQAVPYPHRQTLPRGLSGLHLGQKRDRGGIPLDDCRPFLREGEHGDVDMTAESGGIAGIQCGETVSPPSDLLLGGAGGMMDPLGGDDSVPPEKPAAGRIWSDLYVSLLSSQGDLDRLFARTDAMLDAAHFYGISLHFSAPVLGAAALLEQIVALRGPMMGLERDAEGVCADADASLTLDFVRSICGVDTEMDMQFELESRDGESWSEKLARCREALGKMAREVIAPDLLEPPDNFQQKLEKLERERLRSGSRGKKATLGSHRQLCLHEFRSFEYSTEPLMPSSPGASNAPAHVQAAAAGQILRGSSSSTSAALLSRKRHIQHQQQMQMQMQMHDVTVTPANATPRLFLHKHSSSLQMQMQPHQSHHRHSRERLLSPLDETRESGRMGGMLMGGGVAVGVGGGGMGMMH
uniref:Cyclin N-terminal domain-containing protein n=1 Tax=Chromera velia CCMP2878 TaxID=1169474 RepID=A0A0G4GKA6_9ALVE|eukprot:Cvel_22278.t1-p1 / transcript=Cvel_22278.t1 / gene=Cvel_22278 / organism=Chromera_velia_CCMP2878 / gene_product=hypothetical protein / transcript_product=hypothetical protein / location=Cvel_scaffold2174:785-4357(+) / protein_length=848 / sequence_SO=supercontig / SO=protein_coding / is_pseudo=false